MAEPLWRGKTKRFLEGKDSYIGFTPLHVEPGTEVEVWPARDRVIYHAERVGDHWEITQEVWPAGSTPTRPTREQVYEALRNWLVSTSTVTFHARDEEYAIGGATNAVMALFAGEEDDDG